MFRRIHLVALVAAILTLGTGVAMAETKTVSGSVTYLNRSMLPPGAVLDVELVDVSRQDAPSIQLSARRYAIDHVPFPFELAYDASLIGARLAYAVQARISVADRVMYRSTTTNLVLTRGAPEAVEIVLELMPAPVAVTLEGRTWEVNELGGRAVITKNRPSISFLPDAMVGIVGGCNRFGGPVEIVGDSMRFSEHMAGTARACAPPYDQLERDFLQALQSVSGYALSDASLASVNRAGVAIVRLSPMK